MIQLSHDVTTRSTGVGMALARTANIVEQAAHLHASGRQVSLICGGASGVGRQILENQNIAPQPSPERLPIPSRPIPIIPVESDASDPSESDLEAIGNPSMMAVYETMFNVYGIRCGQIQPGPISAAQIQGLQKMRTFPLINMQSSANIPSDSGLPSDSRSCAAAVLAKELGCDLLVLLSEAEGAYTADPAAPDARVVPIVTQESADNLSIQQGLENKLVAAQYAMSSGVPTVVASGYQWRSILDIVEGKEQGTVFMDI